MLYYLDSSAVVKRYATERGNSWVCSLTEPSAKNTIYLAQIAIVEVAAALGRKLRTKGMSQQEYESALILFLADVRKNDYAIACFSDSTVDLAVELTRRHPLRGYDAVHLALAIGLNTAMIESGLSPLIFVSADDALCQAARDEGLSADNPNDH